MYTLKNLLDSNIIPRRTLLTEPRDFSSIPLLSVSVQELPLDDFIQKDELVLSTALGCGYNSENFKLIIEGAAEAGAAAIFFAFKKSSMVIPEHVLRYANKAGLPVFEIPWEHRFSDIQKAVLSSVSDERLSELQAIQNKLFNLFFESKTLDDAQACISEATGTRAWITSDAGDRTKGGAPGVTQDTTDDAATMVDISLGGVKFGRLYIQLPYEEQQHALFERYLAFPLSLWFNKKNIEYMTAIRLKNDFVRNLADGNYVSFDEMVRQGSLLKFDLMKPYVGIAMRAVLTEAGAFSVSEYSSQMAEDAVKMEEILLQVGKQQGLSVMVTNLSLEFTLFLEVRPPYRDESVKGYIDRAEGLLHQAFPRFTLFWGISDFKPSPIRLSRLSRDAALALKYCLNSKDGRRRLTYKDTRKALIVSVLAGNKELQSSAKEALGGILSYDKTSDMDLLGTLTEYISTNYNTSQAARNLNIHRQTLLYRLEKIEALTGMSLSSHDDLFVLEAFSRLYAFY